MHFHFLMCCAHCFSDIIIWNKDHDFPAFPVDEVWLTDHALASVSK